ncbi:Imm1 family immunity protein [Micromonospora sp. HUAS LYJ1]|uniref:Imm1 family immunity protein n=1 Tax=Micromonospora sp. HUAS LYJ1 TaxID=3061626 RepID=UPI0026736457|nr:Imm1 family immunity protein [Micromonospora sp. HUAS LYJ1]WKU03927.1 Imm1 family immunity protein [Micromonospora sp. HUAS LYJ1]
MTLLLRDYHGHAFEPADAEDAGRRFDEQIATIMPHEGSGQTLTIGTHDQPTLRIDIDIDADRAAVRWLPDGSYAAERQPDTPITVYESPDTGLVDIARVAPAAARTAVVEYVTTGQRPTNIRWWHADQYPSLSQRPCS